MLFSCKVHTGQRSERAIEGDFSLNFHMTLLLELYYAAREPQTVAHLVFGLDAFVLGSYALVQICTFFIKKLLWKKRRPVNYLGLKLLVVFQFFQSFAEKIDQKVFLAILTTCWEFGSAEVWRNCWRDFEPSLSAEFNWWSSQNNFHHLSILLIWRLAVILNHFRNCQK